MVEGNWQEVGHTQQLVDSCSHRIPSQKLYLLDAVVANRLGAELAVDSPLDPLKRLQNVADNGDDGVEMGF